MTIDYEVRQSYDCRRCGKTINWQPGSTRHDMLKAQCCVYCTCLTTLWPRRIRRAIVFIPLAAPFVLYAICAAVAWVLGTFFEGVGRRLLGPFPEDPRKNRGLYGTDPLEVA